MFEIDSRERQAHHTFMTMISTNGLKYKLINNHELIGKAAAYHAACRFTHHVNSNGLPKTQRVAQQLIINYAKEFIRYNICEKGLKVQKDKAMKFAEQSLGKAIYNPNPSTWRVKHSVVQGSYEEWMHGEDPIEPDFERWIGNDRDFNFGSYGPHSYNNSRPASIVNGERPPPPVYTAPQGPPGIPFIPPVNRADAVPAFNQANIPVFPVTIPPANLANSPAAPVIPLKPVDLPPKSIETSSIHPVTGNRQMVINIDEARRFFDVLVNVYGQT